MRLASADRRVFPPLQRVRIEKMACTEPKAFGWHLDHWDCRSLAQAVVEQSVVDSIHYTTVARMLRRADLQPHRSRLWKTATIDAQFIQRAAQVLWCYENVETLHQRGEVVLCVDEKPNMQVLERRCPTQPTSRGNIRRREFEYIRHGTVNFLATLDVYDGRMQGRCLDANDHQEFCFGLTRLLKPYRDAERVHLIMDNGSSHTAEDTRIFLRQFPPVRPLFTPPHASWLNQAELLLRAFSQRYLKEVDTPSRSALVEHLQASWPEYNRRFAHPISWSWTRRDLRGWAKKRNAVICSKTFATVH